ncbi:MAG TPA: cell wall hydrolase [Caulobacteraceae bacterium]
MSFPLQTRAKARALGVGLLAAAWLGSTQTSLGGGAARAADLPLLRPPPVDAKLAGAPSPVLDPVVAPIAASPSGDLECLAQAVYYEARGESAEGQAAVAQVVLNRSRLVRYPATVCGVVYQGRGTRTCQFSFVCNGAMRGTRDFAAWERSRSVAARALGGYVMETVRYATSFHACGAARQRGRTAGGMVRLGGHVFFGGDRAGLVRVAVATAQGRSLAS